MTNEQNGLKILYQNALSGSMVNTDLLYRVIESDKEALHETFYKLTADKLRVRDRESMHDLRNYLDTIKVTISESIKRKISYVTESISDYIRSSLTAVASSSEDLDQILQFIDSLKEDLESLDESISHLSTQMQEIYDDTKTSEFKQCITNAHEHLENLSTHATQMFVVILTIEGSAQQCKMTY